MPVGALAAILIALSIGCASPAQGAIYKWVNPDGSVGFSDDLSQVPERQRPTVELKTYPANENRGTLPPRSRTDAPRPSAPPPVREPTRTQAAPPSPPAPTALSEDENRKADAEIRGIWDKFRKALRGERIE
jgi:hypothetical protein